MRAISLIVVHCSATREDKSFTEHDLDVCHRRRGFNGVGYHFYIRKNGDIKSTRPLERIGAHARGFNSESIGICYEGGLDSEGHPKDTRTPWQKHSLRVLILTLLRDYPGCRVCGHRDLSPDLNGNGEIEPEEWIKACPCFDAAICKEMKDTKQQFEHVIAICRDLFSKKLHDYGPAWRILRPASVTDQIFIKANRIRSIETKGVTLVDEGIRSEFIAIVNYGIIGLIQLELGYAESADITNEEAMALYDKYAKTSLDLMLAKNHDYDEAWRSMRVSSYTDLILMKIYRTKQIESLSGQTLVSEGVDANYMDMINYSVFGLIKIEFGD